MTYRIEQGDCIEWMNREPEASVDLVLGSPPYCDARTYGVGASYNAFEWVEWMLRVTEAACRISRGLVLWVCAGVTRENCYWPAPEGLAWEWFKRGRTMEPSTAPPPGAVEQTNGYLWRPVAWWKVDEEEGGSGIPGSGGNVPGKRWLRADWEYVLCFGKADGIPYDNPTAMGHPPIDPRVGGLMSNRTEDGRRINRDSGNGPTKRKKRFPCTSKGNKPEAIDGRPLPTLSNPGNVLAIRGDGVVVKARVGGGHMGSRLCHEGEAPYPEKLADFFVQMYCPPGGTVCDPFSGSGTTAAVTVASGRNFLGCDVRQSQVDLGLKRLSFVTPDLFGEST